MEKHSNEVVEKGNTESWWNYTYYHRGGEGGQMNYHIELILPEALFTKMRVQQTIKQYQKLYI